MSDVPHMPDLPPDADPAALLAFMQRLMATIQQGGDVDAMLAEAPPGFDALFLEAQRRLAAGELAGFDSLLGGFDESGEPIEPDEEAEDES